MGDSLDALYEAHVAFELAQWTGDQVPARISAEAAAFHDWCGGVRLGDITSAGTITAAARRLVIEGHLPDELTTVIGNIAAHLIGLPVNRETRVGDVVDDDLFEAGVELSIDMRHARDEIVGQVLRSPLYSMLVSEILYNGIKDYLLGEGSITSKLTGSSRLLGKGASAIGKRLSGLDAQVEKRIRKYIEENADTTADASRGFLEHALTDDRIREMARAVWAEVAESPLSLADALRDEDVEAVTAFGRHAWLHLRQTDYVAGLIEEGIAEFFRLHAGDTLADLLALVGVNREVLEREGQELVPPLLDIARETGFLEAVIRRRLEAFYRSDAAREALSGG